MIDINDSRDYDEESFNELLAEERRKVPAYSGLSAFAGANALGQLGTPVHRTSDAIVTDAARADEARELTDPIEFLKQEYEGRRLFRFILTHPDLDHMRG